MHGHDAAAGSHTAETRATVREAPGFESQPHLRLFLAFCLLAGGFLVALGTFVSFGVDRHTTLEDLQRLPGIPSPAPQRPGPAPRPADPWDEPPALPFPTAWPAPEPPRLPELPRFPRPPGG
ncbi:hypothetical protein [Streptomyces sp. NPDC090021]|uniref:hypothetical protein n=1 Tax=Streptomyces sp. NPDC090021 TaxID=3365919 RepID=UPI00380B33FE